MPWYTSIGTRTGETFSPFVRVVSCLVVVDMLDCCVYSADAVISLRTESGVSTVVLPKNIPIPERNDRPITPYANTCVAVRILFPLRFWSIYVLYSQYPVPCEVYEHKRTPVVPSVKYSREVKRVFCCLADGLTICTYSSII